MDSSYEKKIEKSGTTAALGEEARLKFASQDDRPTLYQEIIQNRKGRTISQSGHNFFAVLGLE